MRKLILTLIILTFLIPASASFAGQDKTEPGVMYNNPGHHRMYDKYENSWGRGFEKDSRYDDPDGHYRRGGHYRYKNHHHHDRSHRYKGHYTDREWFDNKMYRKYPGGVYHCDDYGHLMFSYFDRGTYFSFSIGK